MKHNVTPSLGAVCLMAVMSTTVALLPSSAAFGGIRPFHAQSAVLQRRNQQQHQCRQASPSISSSSSSSSSSSCVSRKRRSRDTALSVSLESPPQQQQQQDNDDGDSAERKQSPNGGQSSYTDTASLNAHLATLASQCGNHHNPIVGVASKAEQAYHQHPQERDTESLNILLTGWASVCETMALHRSDLVASTTASIEIYKPRDAAEHMTRLLLEAEEEYMKELKNCEGETASEQDDDDEEEEEEEANESSTDAAATIPDRKSYNLVMEGWAKTRAADATAATERLFHKLRSNDRLGIDTDSYHAVLDAWAHSKDPNAYDRMQKIWNNMVETSKTNKDIAPSSTTVHFLVRACVRLAKEATDAEEAMEAAESAFGLLRQQRRDHSANSRTTANGGTNHLGNMEPDADSYSMVIEAFAQVGSYEGAKQAEHVMAMLQREYELQQSPKLRPTVNTYNSLIRAWTHMRKGKSLTRFSERWVREIEKHPDIQPNLRTYALELQSWARAASNETAQQVLKILMKLRKNSKDNEQLAHLRPTLSMYNLAIDACARTKGDPHNQMEALKVAFAIYKTIQKEPKISPDSSTYANLAKVAAFLLPHGQERNDIAVKVMQMAKDAAVVSPDVVKFFQIAADSTHRRLQLGELEDARGKVNYEDIPKAWSANVRRNK